MVSNQIKRGCFAFPFLIISMLLLTGICKAQNISHYYTSSFQGNNTLYFVMPKGDFKNNKTRSNLSYDITYLTTNDTATLIFSYLNKSINIIDSIAIVQNYKIFSSRSIKLFIEPHHSKWQHRYSSKFLFTDLFFLFNQTDRPKIMIYSKLKVDELSITPSDWKKNSAIVSKILSMIKVNKEK